MNLSNRSLQKIPFGELTISLQENGKRVVVYNKELDKVVDYLLVSEEQPYIISGDYAIFSRKNGNQRFMHKNGKIDSGWVILDSVKKYCRFRDIMMIYPDSHELIVLTPRQKVLSKTKSKSGLLPIGLGLKY